MKQLTLCLVLATALLAGCNHKSKKEGPHTLSGTQCYLLVYNGTMFDGIDTVGEVISYNVAWPDAGMLSPEALRELQYLCFDDSTGSVEEAAARWLTASNILDDEEVFSKLPVDSIDTENMPYSYLTVESEYTTDSGLAVFVVRTECFPYGAAHGIYAANFLTVDRENGRAIHLTDLVADTTLLCKAIAQAIHTFDDNAETLECLFDEYSKADRMPMPCNFTIDKARNGIIVYYGLYEITPYCCGIQEVVLPAAWLSKQVPLTPYAERLLCTDSDVRQVK